MDFGYKEIIALAKAGFSTEQIEKIANSIMTEEAPKPEEVKAAPPAAVEPKAPAAEPKAPAAEPKAPQNLDAILDKLDKLTTAIHANAIINSTQPTKETPDDIIAGMINPKKGEK